MRKRGDEEQNESMKLKCVEILLKDLLTVSRGMRFLSRSTHKGPAPLHRL